jgi:hypothetical protein
MAASKGTKLACTKCGTKFYDLNKNPPRCPKCKAEQASAGKSRHRSKKISKTKSGADDSTQSGLYTFGLVDVGSDDDDRYISPSLKNVNLGNSLNKVSGWFVVSLDEENAESGPIYIRLPAAPLAGLKRYLATWRFEGVGPKIAEKFVSSLENFSFAFLDGASGKFEPPSAVDSDLLKTIKDSWAKNSDSNMLHVFLHELDLQYGVINSIESEIGERIVEVISKDPFSLVSAIPRFTFEDARRVIKFLDVNLTAERLVAAATNYRLMKSERERGHTCGPMDRVVPEVAQLVAMTDDVVREILNSLTDTFNFKVVREVLMVSRKEAFERDSKIIESLRSLKDGDSSKYEDCLTSAPMEQISGIA